MRRLLPFLFFIMSALNLLGQAKVNPYLQHVIEDSAHQEVQIPLLVKGDLGAIRTLCHDFGGYFKVSYRPYASVSIPGQHVFAFAQSSGIDRIEFNNDNPQVLNNLTSELSNLSPARTGFPPLITGYTGKNVVVGIVDTGIELEHPDFWNTDSTTRIYRLWDQRVNSGTGGGTPDNYGYGVVYTNSAIDSGIVTHDDLESFYGHGTHVAGIAAGNGQTVEKYTGMAPEATLVIVASNFSSFNWKSSIVDAIDYIFKVADSLGFPAVVNASLGSYNGSHDGKDASTQLIDAMILEKGGRSVISALGNSGEVGNFHLGYDVSSDTSFTWFEQYENAQNGGTAISFELWADTGSFEQVQMGLGVDLNDPEYVNIGQSAFFQIGSIIDLSVFKDTIWSDTIRVATIEVYPSLSEGTYSLSIRVNNVDSANAYVRFSTFGEGHFDVWSTRNKVIGSANMIHQDLPLAEEFPDVLNYVAPDKWSSLITAWGCSEHVIGVGNYTGRSAMVDYDGVTQTYTDTVGKLANSSSYGPTRDGRIKPDLVAPGEKVLSAGRIGTLNTAKGAASWSVDQQGWHNLNSGTSMSAPAVAGAVALLLESCPTLTNAEIKQMLIDGATTDAFTGNDPDNRYGHGKLNVYNSLLKSPNQISLNESGILETCEVIDLTLDGAFNSYLWNNSSTTSSIQANQNLTYHASAINETGCFGLSDTVQVTIDPYRIESPSLVIEGSLVLCDGESVTLKAVGDYKAFEWSHDDDVDQFKVTVEQTNFYSVEVTDFNGCRAFSDTVTVSMNPTPPTPTITLGTDSLISSIANSYQWYLNDTVLEGAMSKVLANITDTGYFKVITALASGCSSESAEVFFAPQIPLSIKTPSRTIPFKATPIPFSDHLMVTWGIQNSPTPFALYNSTGQIVQQFLINSGTSSVQISTSNLPPGVYHLVANDGSSRVGKRVVKY